MMGLVLVSGAAAQVGGLKQQLVGTWTFVAVELTLPSGNKRLPAGPSPNGLFVFDAGGRFIFSVERPDRPKFQVANRPTTQEVFDATQDWFSSNFGTWSVNDADKSLTLRYEGSLRPNNKGAEEVATVELSGDELRLTGRNALDTGARPYFQLRRAK